MNSSHLLLWFRSAQLSRARYGNTGVLCVCALSRISVRGRRNVLDKIAGVTQNPAQSNVVNMAAIYKVQEVHQWQVEMRTVDGSNVQAKTNRWGAFLSAPELLISKDRTLRTLGCNLHDYGQTQCQRFTCFWPCRVTVCSACVTTVCVWERMGQYNMSNTIHFLWYKRNKTLFIFKVINWWGNRNFSLHQDASLDPVLYDFPITVHPGHHFVRLFVLLCRKESQMKIYPVTVSTAQDLVPKLFRNSLGMFINAL